MRSCGRHRMRAHDRMRRIGKQLLHLAQLGLVFVGLLEQRAEVLEVVHGAQPVDHLLEGVAQAVIGRLHVGPQRVAADLRHDLAAQDRVLGRVLAERRVAVPHVGREDRIVLMIVEHQDFRELALRPHRMDFELAEMPAHGDVLRGVHVLVAHEEHLVLDQGRLERRSPCPGPWILDRRHGPRRPAARRAARPRTAPKAWWRLRLCWGQ